MLLVLAACCEAEAKQDEIGTIDADPGYISKVDMKKTPGSRRRRQQDDTRPPERQVFRGFIGGTIFTTKKGFKGMKLDSLWAKHLMESFKLDDFDLASIAVQSCLADIKTVVTGGEFGTPFSIGDFGFYSESQFNEQFEVLKAVERQHAERISLFLSDGQWSVVDENLNTIANFGVARFKSAVIGDSWISLAIRENAFGVAEVLLGLGLDPLQSNEKGEDMCDLLKLQYAALTADLRSMQEEKRLAAQRVLLPSESEAILAKELKIVTFLKIMRKFADSLSLYLERRIVEIERDKREKRKADIRKETLSFEKLQNIERHEKAKLHLEECHDLKHYIEEKLRAHSLLDHDLSAMAELVRLQHDAGEQLPTALDVMVATSRSKTSRGKSVGRDFTNGSLPNEDDSDTATSTDISTTTGTSTQQGAAAVLSFADTVAREHLGPDAGRNVALGILVQSDNEVVLFK